MIETSDETIRRSMSLNNGEQRFSLYSIDDPNDLPFDSESYSLYKYGDTNQAQLFGQQLAAGFLHCFGEFLLSSSEDFLGISSPRGAIPPAAYFIFKTFLENLNRFLEIHQRKPIIEHTIQRLGTLAEDYSMLSREERFQHLVDERYFIDRKPIGKSILIFVDDIRITGMHELNIVRLLENFEIYNRRLFVYYAQLVNDQIPSSFEHDLNRFCMKNLEELCRIIKNPKSNFRINTRVLKEILRSNPKELNQFLESINVDLMREIYHACLACHYQSIPTFADRLQIFQHIIEQVEKHEQSS